VCARVYVCVRKCVCVCVVYACVYVYVCVYVCVSVCGLCKNSALERRKMKARVLRA